ncbi:hypothetical protein A6V39_04180 [Candidatus Mycoplasma haematobovis]|uniref:Uncharacterized protein n=1 Tax=Candidatus Mycoplasma haematobovis TaxID=432608 RepID=A0A1A9QC94_9MOLU|nr:hypothetical protein [Candidatus Mycoplasma haematobovis]OAL10087.1 hypothetical protein A6V39_04180 [Candidatus Mycoplasma haematobovis]
MLGIKVASGFTAISAVLFSGYHYLSIKSGTISNVLINEGYELIENLSKNEKIKIYEASFKRNKVYIGARKDFLKGTTYELKDFDDDEEGGIALAFWCKEVTTKPVRANSSHHLMYASQWCTLNFEDKLKQEAFKWDDSIKPEEWKKKIDEIEEISGLPDKDIEEEAINWCNSKRNTIFNKLSKEDYEAVKVICRTI